MISIPYISSNLLLMSYKQNPGSYFSGSSLDQVVLSSESTSFRWNLSRFGPVWRNSLDMHFLFEIKSSPSALILASMIPNEDLKLAAAAIAVLSCT